MSNEPPPNISTIKYTIERIIRNHIMGEFAFNAAKQHIKEYLNSLPIYDYVLSTDTVFSFVYMAVAIKLTKTSNFHLIPFKWSPK